MKYRKVDEDKYNLHLISTDKFKTITIKVNFKRKLIKEEITKRNFLINSLMEGSYNYPSKRLLEIKTEELYDLGYRGSNYSTGKYTVMCFEATFINPKYTESSMLDESFEFLSELIYNPNIKDNKFDDKNFSLAYNIIRDYLKTLEENPRIYANMRMLEEMNEDIISYRNSGYLSDLDAITDKNLYEYYLDVINNDILDIFVIGDIDDIDIEKLVKENIKPQNNIKTHDSHFYVHNKIEDKIKFVSEKVSKEQSTLVVGLKMEEMTDFEKRYVLSVYNYIIGGSTESNLFQTVREKNSLCYYITSSAQSLLSILTITSGINSKDYEQTISLINKELENMCNGVFDDEKIENAKTTYISGLSELEDSPESIVSLYAGIEYLNADTIEKRKENIMKVTKDDIIKVANKIHLNTIFLLEGCDNIEQD